MAQSDGAGDVLDGLEHVVVVVPVDGEVDEAQEVREEDGPKGLEGLEGGGGLVGDFELQDHDGDEDGWWDAIAECFEPAFGAWWDLLCEMRGL